MKVFDTSFLIDYGNAVDAAGEYLKAHAEEALRLPGTRLYGVSARHRA